jgi:two-component system cell cycle sensor histidine kinase/response regulator CckA
VLADPGQVEQVLLNLAVNARDAMPSGGLLTVTTSNNFGDEIVPDDHPIPADNFVVMTVTDNGIGMSKEIRKRVFEPFFTTKEQGKGTGLGLATVYGIVTQSGGHVTLTSEEGQGSAFSIYLPRIDESAVKPTGREKASELAHGSETILFVEDEAQLRTLTTRTLSTAGYTVISASNGDEALALLDAATGSIDLVVSDVVMPGMSGPALVAKIREHLPEIKALYISGYTDDALSHHGVLDPDIHLLLKPFSTRQLASAVRAVLDGNSPDDLCKPA